MSTSDSILIRTHLGLGDMLVCNGIFRHYAEKFKVFVCCKRANVPTVVFMLRDLANVEVIAVDDDKEANEFCDLVASYQWPVLRLGMFGKPPYDSNEWDVSHYNQAGVPFQDRWNNFKCARQPSRELSVPSTPFCFVHECPSRGFKINPDRLPKDLPIIFSDPTKTQNLFDWWGHIEMATELHLIDSCFAILADSLPELKARNVTIHVDARPDAKPPKYIKTVWKDSVWRVIP